MNFNPSESEKKFTDSVKNFAQENIAPYYQEWDEKEAFPRTLFEQMGKKGYTGALVPEQYQGSALSYFQYVSLISEIAQKDPSIALSVAAHNSLCSNHILSFGSDEQKNRWLPQLASGQYMGAWALTEHNTGSDAKNMHTTAYKDGNEWVLNGQKNFITQGISSDVLVVIARTGEKRDHHGMSAFILERNTPGFSSGMKIKKLGMHASETAELFFNNCRLPENHCLGKVGEGFMQAMKILDDGRISIGAVALGIAKGAFENALRYAQKREQFSKPIASFQAISFKLAQMATKIEAAELLIHKACHQKQKGCSTNLESAMCKYYASEVAVEIANEAVQTLGGYGYTRDYPVEKFYRDAKLCTIGEGTSEILQLVICKNLLKKIAKKS
ncbi:acyl-CoA dehydrogenase family protein [Bacteroidetes bacterium endosymbiont of Geopemphigus sp.]|uniref:acyl-CoA dehydrogenase family protein n=1 Tax=Bacteroidetes bacterium endosymbiont of Geopemphigus sp. TaxID=2047937 RepID=UPI000CD2298D|nr:acyl-CoA dehydrogenase family protein [Bacteroidetes bacterium endosymbiont of Geopemphigus sp.]